LTYNSLVKQAQSLLV